MRAVIFRYRLFYGVYGRGKKLRVLPPNFYPVPWRGKDMITVEVVVAEDLDAL